MRRHELLDASTLEQARAIRERQLSSFELVSAYLDRIAARDAELRAFVQLEPRRALAEAREKDRSVARGGPLPPFHGIPIGIKDLNLVRGFGMQAGSRALRWLAWSPIDDRSAAALRRAGFVIVGKLATSELGAMPVTEPDIHPPTRNPWNPDYSPGGSSGGSGAAVAAGLLPLAHGSDGAGSVRIPAAFCHLFGLKPSRARVPNQFGIRDPRVLYTCGPITRTVEDAAAMLDVMHDRDRRSAVPRAAASFLELSQRRPARLRIRVSTRAPFGTTHPEIAAATLRVARTLERAGHRLEEAPVVRAELAEFLPLWQALVASARLPLGALQPVTRWLAESGRRVSRADREALHDALAARVRELFGDVDLWLTPAVAVPPPRIGAWSALPPSAAFSEAAVLGAFTALFNITGQPAASVPAGLTSEGLPIGVQLAGRPFEDGVVLAVARELEEAMPWRQRRPPLAA
ncbi:MAG TPA: amidase [Polyangiales bacterium]|nr:amidase [Polyangiales bacterium]